MKIIRYFFVGAAAAAVDITVFGLLAEVMGLPWFSVSVFSFLLATAFNYALSVSYVFTSGVRFARHHETLLVFAVSSVGLALNQAVLWLMIENLLWNLMLAKATATACVFFWNYGIRKNFIFHPA